MDAQAQKKALFRAKLKEAAQKREKHIESPLVRYNEYDQPVCRVCDVTLKSESLWNAHQASRKHHEAIKNVKDAATGLTRVNDIQSDPPNELVHKTRASSSLPADFFDKHETKKQNTGLSYRGKINPVISQTSVKPAVAGSSPNIDGHIEGFPIASHPFDLSDFVKETDELANVDLVETKGRSESIPSGHLNEPSRKTEVSEAKKGKGTLPEGFFDNKDADLRARGIEPVKLDIKDEYKEFEKVIQEDLKEVDDRLEEEEFDAAETREVVESLEQKGYRERVEMLKKKQMELKAERFANGKKSLSFMGKESSDESSSDGDRDEENFTVDWRAKHL
ncbi:protein ABA AND ROS SENSITIVE 1-like isoform X2 [Tasmannia lanceolata]|uniref:protein ABA AND ROS SENSITIVE 1-like isoform X2 n=1 Tax=Tasmannia lanceolata TaxID=3420 RepID=UPI004063FD8D